MSADLVWEAEKSPQRCDAVREHVYVVLYLLFLSTKEEEERL